MHALGNVQWTMASLQDELEALVNGNEPVDVLRARTASVLASLPSPGLGVDLNFSLGPVMTNKQVDRTVARLPWYLDPARTSSAITASLTMQPPCKALRRLPSSWPSVTTLAQ